MKPSCSSRTPLPHNQQLQPNCPLLLLLLLLLFLSMQFSMGPRNAIKIHRSTFHGNNCSSGCGINMVDGQLDIQHSLFTGHAAATLGGGAFFDRARVTIRDSSFERNAAGSDGGGFVVAETAMVKLESVIVQRNVANRNGGGIFLVLYDEAFYASNLLVRDNSAQFGGGLCINSSESTAYIEDGRCGGSVLWEGCGCGRVFEGACARHSYAMHAPVRCSSTGWALYCIHAMQGTHSLDACEHCLQPSCFAGAVACKFKQTHPSGQVLVWWSKCPCDALRVC